jgi:hypothetical protein
MPILESSIVYAPNVPVTSFTVTAGPIKADPSLLALGPETTHQLPFWFPFLSSFLKRSLHTQINSDLMCLLSFNHLPKLTVKPWIPGEAQGNAVVPFP